MMLMRTAVLRTLFFVPLIAFGVLRTQQCVVAQLEEQGEANSVQESDKGEMLTPKLLEQKLTKIADRDLLPGFAVSVFTKERVLFEKGFGYANLQSKRPYTVDTVQCVASVSKTMVAVALMQAVDAKVLTLDDPINRFLPFSVVHPEFTQTPITVRHLATHTSGIVDGDSYQRSYVFQEKLLESDFPSPWHPLLGIYNHNKPMSLKDYLKATLTEGGSLYEKDSFDQKPGSTYDYSNTAVALLALVVENATGRDFRSFSQERIFQPLKMTHSTWRLENVDSKDHATYYNEKMRAVPPYVCNTYPDGGLFSCARDLRKFAQAVMGDQFGSQVLLSPGSTHQMLFESGMDIDELPVAIIWDIEMGGLVGHSGNDFGTAVYMYFDPETGIGQILFTNVSLEREELENTFDEIYRTLFRFDGT